MVCKHLEGICHTTGMKSQYKHSHFMQHPVPCLLTNKPYFQLLTQTKWFNGVRQIYELMHDNDKRKIRDAILMCTRKLT